MELNPSVLFLLHVVLNVLSAVILFSVFFRRKKVACTILAAIVAAQYCFPVQYNTLSSTSQTEEIGVSSTQETAATRLKTSGEVLINPGAVNPLEMAQEVTGMYQHIINELRAVLGKEEIKVYVPGAEQYEEVKGGVLEFFSSEEAAWLVLRLGLLLFAWSLSVMFPMISWSCFAFSLIPLPYLMHVIDQRHLASVHSGFIKNIIEKHPEADFLAHPVYLPATVLGVIVLFFLFLPVLGDRTNYRVRRFLNPRKYVVQMGNEEWEFKIEGNELVMGDVRLSTDFLDADPKNPNHVQIGGGGVLVFVRKKKKWWQFF